MTTPAVHKGSTVDVARARQIEAALTKIADATGDELRRTVNDLPRFTAVLDALIGADDAYQRRFRREVVVALHRIPPGWGTHVPAKHGFNILHKVIHTDGVERALDRIGIALSPPTWTELIRLYRPEYAAGNVTTLTAHTERARRANKARPRTTSARHRLDAAEAACICLHGWLAGQLTRADAIDAYNAWAHMVDRPRIKDTRP